jgi:hypothetical protein
MRELCHRFHMERVKAHLSVPKIINDKRPTFKQLIIRNYEPPKTPLYTSAAGQAPLMDLFALGPSSHVRG